MPKKANITAMFNDIAPTYDKLNHILSLNVDKLWRKKAVNRLMESGPQTVLDLACGTGDSSFALAQAGVPTVLGLDLSEGMLAVAREKASRLGFENVSFQIGDALAMPFKDGSVDAVMIAFGIRNFEDREGCLKEIRRVLRPGGKLVIVELSIPSFAPARFVYKLYFLHILPFIGKLLSGNKAAYLYLPHSVLRFPKPEDFLATIRGCGFRTVVHKSLSLGLCRIFEGVK